MRKLSQSCHNHGFEIRRLCFAIHTSCLSEKINFKSLLGIQQRKDVADQNCLK